MGPGLGDWPAYQTAVAGWAPSDTLLHALGRFDREPRPRHGWRAVDLDCGAGRDTVELLRRGWRVLAIDRQPTAIQALLRVPDLPRVASHGEVAVTIREQPHQRELHRREILHFVDQQPVLGRLHLILGEQSCS